MEDRGTFGNRSHLDVGPRRKFPRLRHLSRGRYLQISCLPASPRIFEHLKNGVIAHFKRILTLKRSPRVFGSFFLDEIFEKVSFDPYNFRITRLSTRKSEQKKLFTG